MDDKYEDLAGTSTDVSRSTTATFNILDLLDTDMKVTIQKVEI